MTGNFDWVFNVINKFEFLFISLIYKYLLFAIFAMSFVPNSYNGTDVAELYQLRDILFRAIY